MKQAMLIFLCSLAALSAGCSYTGNPPTGDDIESALKTYSNYNTDNLKIEVEECDRTNPMEQSDDVSPNQEYERFALYTCIFVMSYESPPATGQVTRTKIGEFTRTSSWRINFIRDH
ncbi:MAG: hypothetical protein ACEQSD_09205 [Flavobacteriales bacterium]